MSLSWARWLLAAWLALSLAQWLVIAGQFGVGGALPWARLASLAGPRWKGAIQRRLSANALRAFFIFQLFLVLLLAAIDVPGVTIFCLAALLACHAAFVILAGHFWVDGSDKMGIIVMAGTLLTAVGLAAQDAGVALAGILLAGGQLTLSYCIAGISKLFVPGWRSGAWLRSVMATNMWGDSRMAALLRVPGFATLASWTVILLEALFPLALLAPETVLLAAMVAMLVFHFATAFFMGLNKFPWAFAAAYPAVFLLGRLARSASGLGA